MGKTIITADFELTQLKSKLTSTTGPQFWKICHSSTQLDDAWKLMPKIRKYITRIDQ